MNAEDAAVELLRVVARLNRWATRHATIDVPAARARVLALIDDLAPARVTDLASADNTAQPTMTQQVTRLERDGLVSRSPDPLDARASLVRLTPKGAEALAQARRARAKALAPALDRLNPDPRELGAAVELLERVLAAANEPTT